MPILEAVANKQCLTKVVPLAECRKFLYNRLRRKLLEEKCVDLIKDSDPDVTRDEAIATLERYFFQNHLKSGVKWEEDVPVEKWLAEQIENTNSHLNIMIQQNQSDTMLKQVLKLSENQEVDQIADVVQVKLHFQLIKKTCKFRVC